MISSHRHLTIPWLFLIVLTTIGFLAGAADRSPRTLSNLVPLLTAAAKFAIVAWFFMELRGVSRLWTFGIAGLLGLILIVIVGLHAFTS